MAVIRKDPEGDKARARIIRKIFNLPDGAPILENWTMESDGGDDHAMLTISLAAKITMAQVNDLFNGTESEGNHE
jgi:hypothetical protein